ncbi:MAG: nicotinamide-nucleotide amidohydrolase family protein [Erysipelotrichaceae bacterium]|nr:nicotinamide-nucleotide amidohydrolase family protein [Erysipelotrichaceae bacterium]
MQQLVDLLKERKLTVSGCESLTAGLFMSTLGNIPSVSKVFKGGIVTYWNEAKTGVAHVSPLTVERYGVVSCQCAYEMAHNVRRIFATDIGVSFTGNAGPDVMEGKPAGLIYTCIEIGDQANVYEDLIRDRSRNEVRNEIVRLTAERIKELLGVLPAEN